MPPTLKVEIGFVINPLDTPTWVDVTGYVRTSDPVRPQRGRTYELDQAQAGTCTLVLNDPDRAFDPDNLASPYWPNIRPMQRLRVSGVWMGTTYEQFVGYILAWDQSLPIYRHRTVTISATDAIGAYLGLVTVSTDPVSQTIANAAISYMGGTATTTIFPLAIYQLKRNGATPVATGGTFTLSFRGYTTTPLPYNATGAQVRAALETLPSIGADTIVMALAMLTTVLSSTTDIFFRMGGPYTGLNVSDMTINNAGLSPAGAQYQLIYTAPDTTGAPAGYFPNPLGRRPRAKVNTALANNVNVQISGLDSSRLSLTEAIAAPTVAGAYFTNIFYKIFQIQLFTINAADVGKTVTIDFPVTTATLSSDQFEDLLDAIAWPAADRDIQVGRATLQTISAGGETALSYLSKIVEAENGTLFVARDGKVTFRNRSERIVADVTATFSNREAAGLPYQDIVLRYSDRYIYNDIRVTRDGGTEQIAQDSISTGTYLTRSLSKSGLLLTSDSEAKTFAQFLRRIYKDPATRLERLTLQGEDAPDELWPVLLGAELGQRHAVIHYPFDDTTDPFSVEVHIEQIGWTIQNGVWSVEWTLSPAISGFWVLGRSRLGRDTRLGF